MAHELAPEAKAWKTIWSAGQGVGSIHDAPSVAELVTRLRSEFDAARATFADKAKLYDLS
jgi:nitronate monooxygenase